MRHLTAQQLTATADEQLTGVSLEVVRRHLGICPDCRSRLEHFTHQRDALREALGTDPGEDFWDELFERIEARLHTIDVAPARAERPRPARSEPEREPLAAAPVRTAPVEPPPASRTNEPPRLRVITVAAPGGVPAAEPVTRRPLRGVLIGATVFVVLLTAAILAVLRAPVPAMSADTRASWMPQAIATVRETAARIVAPLAHLVARPKPAPVQPPAPTPATTPDLSSARLAHVEPATPQPSAPVTLASPALPVTTPAAGRRTPAIAPEPRVKLPRPAPVAATTPKPVPAAPTPAAPVPEKPRPAPPAAPAPLAPESAWPLFCGQVSDATGQPVAGARVQLADLDLGGRTDRRGRFCMAMPPGERTLTISALGFATWRQLVNVGGGTTEIQVTLKDPQ